MQPPARASTQRRHGVDIERRFEQLGSFDAHENNRPTVGKPRRRRQSEHPRGSLRSLSGDLLTERLYVSRPEI
jgi:hypothetical protein